LGSFIFRIFYGDKGGFMVSRKLHVSSLILAAALISGALIGCGGSSATTSNAGGSIQTTGGVTTTTGNSTTSGSSSTSFQQVQVNTSAGPITGVVPPGQPAFTPSTILGIIPAGQPFIAGMSTTKFQKRAPGANPINISYNQGATWSYSGSNVQPDGSINPPIVYVAGTKSWLQAVGPFTFVGGTVFKPAVLNVQQFIFGIVVDATGAVSIPVAANYKLPVNGGTLAGGNFAQVTYTPNFATGSGYFAVSWAGVTKHETEAVTNGTVQFQSSHLVGPASDNIPGTGVDLVECLYNQ